MPYADPKMARANARAYWATHPEYRERVLAARRAKREADPAAARSAGREYVAAYRERHPDRIAEYKSRPASRVAAAAYMARKREANPGVAAAEARQRYHADPDASTKSRARVHGLTVDDYRAMFDAQDGRCAICRQVETARGSNGRTRRLAIDHDHTTGDIRGLLCHACNVALGLFNDDPELLVAAAGYLRTAARRTALHVMEG